MAENLEALLNQLTLRYARNHAIAVRSGKPVDGRPSLRELQDLINRTVAERVDIASVDLALLEQAIPSVPDEVTARVFAENPHEVLVLGVQHRVEYRVNGAPYIVLSDQFASGLAWLALPDDVILPSGRSVECCLSGCWNVRVRDLVSGPTATKPLSVIKRLLADDYNYTIVSSFCRGCEGAFPRFNLATRVYPDILVQECGQDILTHQPLMYYGIVQLSLRTDQLVQKPCWFADRVDAEREHQRNQIWIERNRQALYALSVREALREECEKILNTLRKCVQLGLPAQLENTLQRALDTYDYYGTNGVQELWLASAKQHCAAAQEYLAQEELKRRQEQEAHEKNLTTLALFFTSTGLKQERHIECGLHIHALVEWMVFDSKKQARDVLQILDRECSREYGKKDRIESMRRHLPGLPQVFNLLDWQRNKDILLLRTYFIAYCRALFRGLELHLNDEGCLGTISEIFEAEAPFRAEGAPAQAWSVAELLSVLLSELGEGHQPSKASTSWTRPRSALVSSSI